jgi:hypothetical protein
VFPYQNKNTAIGTIDNILLQGNELHHHLATSQPQLTDFMIIITALSITPKTLLTSFVHNGSIEAFYQKSNEQLYHEVQQLK